MILVDYFCETCGHTAERWVTRPVATTTDCVRCDGTARRRFGAPTLMGAPAQSAAVSERHSCVDHAGVPGSCTLSPTAARMLAARARGDQRAVDTEYGRQEKAIAEGTLDPRASVTTSSPAHRSA